MPELPEVETVRLQLLKKVRGKTIARIDALHPKPIEPHDSLQPQLAGKTIRTIDRVGKLLIIAFQGQADLFILTHLKMTGQYFYVTPAGRASGGGHSMSEPSLILPNKHTRVALEFTDGSHLYFNDMRLFGYFRLATAADVELARSAFGPEPIRSDFDCEWFTAKLKKRNTPVKAALLDQSFVAGLGNIYVDEALWRARVRPTRRASRVTKTEAALLCKAAGDVMNESIAVGGTTFQHFKDTGGENGNFTDYLQVFGQQGTNCSRCGAIIKKIRCAGRGTHYCPGCQK
jgi:formamidopyrimidine-DNA glycosylase